MVTLLADIHFWTLRDDIIVKDADVGAYRYQEKGSVSKDRIYYQQRRRYIESRGGAIVLKNTRPGRLKDSLKELEEALVKEKLVSEGWRGGNLYQLFFASGLVATVTVGSAGDVTSIAFDKVAIGKLFSDNVIDVASSSSYLLFSYNDARVTLFHATKPGSPIAGAKNPFRFSAQEPKTAICEGVGPAGRRFERKLSINLTEKMVLVWWATGEDEVYPWSPVNKDRDRANLLVYSLDGLAMESMCYCRTELPPLSVAFSRVEENVILTVEQGFDKVGGVTVLSCVYEVERGSLRRVTVTAIPLDAPLTAHAHNPQETCLLLACNNGVLALHCESRGMTHVTKAGMIPSSMAWLPGGSLLAVGNDRGQIQLFDMALSLVRAQLTLEDSAPQRILDFADHFVQATTLRALRWAPSSPMEESKGAMPLLLLRYVGGPLACLRIAGLGVRETPLDTSKGSSPFIEGGPLPPEVLARQYARHGQWDEAVNLLVSLSWETQGTAALRCLLAVGASLLKLSLGPVREAQIEGALSSFLLSPVRFSPAVEEEFGPPVRALTRRFFFKLLRSGCLEKSYRLAIDLKDRDCFMGVHRVARCRRNEELASLALRSARELGHDWHSSGSCSSLASSSSAASSCSTCDSRNRIPHGDDDAIPEDVFEEVTTIQEEFRRLDLTRTSQIPPTTSPVSDPGSGTVQSSQDGTITINVRQGGHSPVASGTPQHSRPPPAAFSSGSRLGSLTGGGGNTGRLRTVEEVCEMSASTDSEQEPIMGSALASVGASDKEFLRRQYEHTIFQEVTTEEEDGGTVKVVHFGVV